MRVIILHPEVAYRDCLFCLKNFHNEETGQPVKTRRADILEIEEYEPRTPQCPPLCRTPKGCPKGTAEDPVELNERNQRAYQHYLECKAIGQFPDDPVVKRNAMIIRRVEDIAECVQEEKMRLAMLSLALNKGMPK